MFYLVSSFLFIYFFGIPSIMILSTIWLNHVLGHPVYLFPLNCQSNALGSFRIHSLHIDSLIIVLNRLFQITSLKTSFSILYIFVLPFKLLKISYFYLDVHWFLLVTDACEWFLKGSVLYHTLLCCILLLTHIKLWGRGQTYTMYT